MIDSFTMLAQLPDAAEASQGPGGVVVVGFLFVIIVLALLSAVTAAMGAWFTKQAAKSAAKAAAASQAAAQALARGAAGGAPAAPASGSFAEEEDPALPAVIAAAVHTAIGDRPHRVVSIRSSGPGWAQEGRRQIFSSHRVR